MIEGTKDNKPVFSLHIDEFEPEGADKSTKDYRITARVHYGGLVLEFDKTVEEVRQFFTERRQKQERQQEQQQVRDGKGKLKTV